MLLKYTRTNANPLTEFGNLSALQPYQGQAVVRPPRAALFRQVQRRYHQVPPEWGMLGGTIPTLPAPAIAPVRVRPRITGASARQFRRKHLPPDYIATVGPGLTARPPFAGTAYGPRSSGRDLLMRQRRYRQIDARCAMSGQTARTVGSFIGAKLGFLSVQGCRLATNFNVAPHRTGSLTVQ